ncbi:MAG: VWA domain-containing protein [Deltaproteobacteria bacterium]|nr:MAG: VWA domain-containing protein [Deltaproteobacteria bacterium]
MRFGFEHPQLLWALPAIALPILIHLLNLHRAARHPFAAVHLLQIVKKYSSRRLMLKQLLLLLLRTALVAALLLAAAGPRWEEVRTRPDGQPSAIAFVVDASFSMRAGRNGRTVFEQMRDRALERASRITDGVRACLVVAGRAEGVESSRCTGSGRRLEGWLKSMEAGFGGSDVGEAISTAARLLERQTPEGSAAKEIVVFTDGAAHAFASGPTTSLTGDESIVVELPREPATAGNYAISAAGAITKGDRTRVSVTVELFGASDVDEKLRILMVDAGDSSVLGSVLVRPLAQEPANKTMSLSAGSEARIAELRLQVKDLLEQDNYRAVYLPPAEKASLLLVDGDMSALPRDDELYFVENSLAAATATGNKVEYLLVPPDRLAEKGLSRYDAVVLANVARPAAAAAAALEGFVANGGGVLISFGDNVDLDYYNQHLGKLLPARLRDVVPLGKAETDGTWQGIHFGRIKTDHPVFDVFDHPQLQALRHVRAKKAVVMEPSLHQGERNVLIEFENGLPALVEHRYGKGKVILLATSIDMDWCNWPTRATYPPFFQRLLGYLAGGVERRTPPVLEVGQPFVTETAADTAAVVIESPSGKTWKLEPQEAGKGRFKVTFSETWWPGWWNVELENDSGQRLAATPPGFVVHPPPSESDLTPIGEKSLRRIVGERAKLLSSARPSAGSSSLSGWLLIVAALALLAESWLIRR